MRTQEKLVISVLIVALFVCVSVIARALSFLPELLNK